MRYTIYSKAKKQEVWTREKMIKVLSIDYPAMKRERLEKLTNTQLGKIAIKRFNRAFIVT